MGGIARVDVATFGAKFYFEKQDFKKTKEFLTTYFKLNKNKKSQNYNDMLLLYTDTLDAIDNPDKLKKEKKKTSTKIIKDTPKIIEKVVETNIKKKVPIIDVDQNQFESEKGEDIEVVDDILEDEIVEDVSFMVIEDVPVFPGCYGNKSELKACFSYMVQMHFSTNFNADLPNTLGLSAGKKRVFIGFTINKMGKVVNVMARAPHPLIEKEVIRVMELLPEIKPGVQRGKNVNVKYSIPFTLIVEGDDEKK